MNSTPTSTHFAGPVLSEGELRRPIALARRCPFASAPSPLGACWPRARLGLATCCAILHLIRRDKINIYDIPISRITREYLAYIEIMQELELEVAGEFFVMAVTLMRLKSQMLLPRRLGTGEEDEDPRDELVRNLIEYRTFKEAAHCLAAKEEERRYVFMRTAPPPPEDRAQVV